METPQQQATRTGNGKAGKRADSGSPLRLYKSGQGKYVRWGTAGGAGAMVFGAATFLGGQLEGRTDDWKVSLIIVLAFIVTMAALTFYYVGRHKKVVDFMIATEGEMKKVNWSSWREVWVSTKVVIACVLGLAAMLFAVDMFFIGFFSLIKLLQVDLLKQFVEGV